MNKLALHPDYHLYERNGKVFCTSLQMAETFEKRHDHVLASIENAIAVMRDFAPEFSGANFIEAHYKDRGKSYPQFF
jgi:phage regulator Rha-like protein